ncbi:pyruvate formate lyase family protein [Breznakiella homolactica]|uniref:Formate C-acetyltransferase n=1 Tax=Breznakiella homolactica TaxID=2798577 RepID=A0A7T8BAX3_9SPIR|nr:pyruvate formate lyase family protein [Breznakiella homolactica]QQO09831.1 hypothetical protein JFL75_02665 [Breznakiella homolactica]
MFSRLKMFIKAIPGMATLLLYRNAAVKLYVKKYGNISESKCRTLLKVMFLFLSNNFLLMKDVLQRTRKLLKIVKISDDENSPFFYSLDTSTYVVYIDRVIGNLTPDYSVLINHSIFELEERSIIWGYIKDYVVRCIKYLEKRNSKFNTFKINHLQRLFSERAESFYEALQRILFTNQLIWQEGHTLIGLGHLDKMLDPYYRHDIENGIINRETALSFIKDFLTLLHKDYAFKSNMLLGDTGQIIILGGINEDGHYFSSELTSYFIQAAKELKLPDPKLLVRVSQKMPIEPLYESIKCLQTGIGYPLFSNDEVIIPALINFGYDEKDAYNYGTSACWEPFIIGKSSDANNVCYLNFAEPFRKIIFSDEDYISFNAMIQAYKIQLSVYCVQQVKTVMKYTWGKSPLLSLFIDNCIEKRIDIADGGAKYNNYGFTSVALSNVINSLLNIKKYVFSLQLFSLEELKSILLADFKGADDIQKLFRNEPNRFGCDTDEVISLTNEIFITASNAVISAIPDNFLHKIKIGLSSPSYIGASENFPATPDGRNANTPFSVHISNEKKSDLTSLFSFASKLDYAQNRFNGNVVDFIVSPQFISNNFDQFASLLKAAFINGVFQIQLNVTNSSTLIKAKEFPESYPNLIVRVWGFSAYFNDLPDNYKDFLIERALEHECSYN